MVLGSSPLLKKNHQKQRSHGKINPGGIDSRHTPDNRAGRTSHYPVNLVKKRNEKIVLLLIHFFRRLSAAYKRIRLVRQRKDQIRLIGLRVPITFQHGNSVKKMTDIHHHRHKSRRKKRRSAGKQINGHILHGTGINQKAHGQSPSDPISVGFQQHAKSHSQNQIACHHRQRTPKCITSCRTHLFFLSSLFTYHSGCSASSRLPPGLRHRAAGQGSERCETVRSPSAQAEEIRFFSCG